LDLHRRQLLLAGLALPAVCLNAVAAPTVEPPLSEPLPADWWSQQFARPEGGQLSLSSLQGRPLLVNFWASWCPPCVKEMPELVRFQREWGKKGWQVIGLAIDGPTPVRQFLSKNPVNFDVGLAGMGGTELASSLGNKAGGLPFSVMISPQGHLIRRKMGATRFDELQAWARALPR